MNKLLSPEYVRKCEYSENNVTCGNEPIFTKSQINISINLNASLSPENMIKCKYSEINTCSEPNNNNNNDDNNNNKDEIVSFMSITVVKNIFNPVSFYNNLVRDVLDNYDVNHELECLGLMNIRIETSQNLKFVESDRFYHSENSILECSNLSENIQNEHNIPFNSEYIKSESKVSPCKVNKFELESEYIESEYLVNKPALRIAVKFKEKNNLL